MDYIPIYLLIITIIACLSSIVITKIICKDTVLKASAPTILQEYFARLQHDLERSRTNITVQEYILMKLGCPAILSIVAYFISSDRSLMVIFIILGFMFPTMVLLIKKEQENKKFEDRFVRALAQMAAALHSGSTVELAIDSVITCELLHESIRDDFRILSSKLKLGIPISQAFYEFADMTKSKDAYDVATAITIMVDVGGDAGVAVEKIQKNIEDRLLYRKKRESMMTESKLIAIFSDVMPILILAGTYLFMPDSINAYFQNNTMTLIFLALIAVLFIGSVVVHKMLANTFDAS